MKKLILLAALPLAISCQSNADNNTAAKTENAATTATTASPKADWNTFYNNFQTAVKNKDTAALRTMCDAKSFDPEFLTNMINTFIESDFVRNTILNTPVEKTIDNPERHEQEELKKYPQLKAVECTEKFGNEMVGISHYYFAEIDGQYKLVYNLQAG